MQTNLNIKEIKFQINTINSYLDRKSNRQRLLFIVPESAGDILLSTSLLRSLKDNYPDHDIYFACLEQYIPLLEDNPYIYKTIPYLPLMDYELAMQGKEEWPGLFDISIMVTFLTQRHSNWIRNGHSKIAFNLRY